MQVELVPAGVGLGTCVQALPSQCSITVWPLSLVPPTAQALVAEIAATPFKTVPPPGSGLGTRVHAAPSQCSIKALLNMPAPTAQASSAETAATSLR